MNIKDYIVHETERQSGTIAEAVGMYQAWEFAHGYRRETPTAALMVGLAGLINGTTDYRKVPAVFNQGSPAVEASLIPRAMENLFKSIEETVIPSNWADSHVIEFLCIHPFADGNGRVGSLLWNWLRGTLSDPEPMPYFFGEA